MIKPIETCRRWLRKLRYKLLPRTTTTTVESSAPDDRALPRIVKGRVPRSTFTKRLTPGRRKDLREALLGMTRPQRLLARRKGWDRSLVLPDGRVRS